MTYDQVVRRIQEGLAVKLATHLRTQVGWRYHPNYDWAARQQYGTWGMHFEDYVAAQTPSHNGAFAGIDIDIRPYKQQLRFRSMHWKDKQVYSEYSNFKRAKFPSNGAMDEEAVDALIEDIFKRSIKCDKRWQKAEVERTRVRNHHQHVERILADHGLVAHFHTDSDNMMVQDNVVSRYQMLVDYGALDKDFVAYMKKLALALEDLHFRFFESDSPT